MTFSIVFCLTPNFKRLKFHKFFHPRLCFFVFLWIIIIQDCPASRKYSISMQNISRPLFIQIKAMEHSRPDTWGVSLNWLMTLSWVSSLLSWRQPAAINIVLSCWKNISGPIYLLLRSSLASLAPLWVTEYWFLCKFGRDPTGSSRIEQEYSCPIMFNFGKAGLPGSFENIQGREESSIHCDYGCLRGWIVCDSVILRLWWLWLRCVRGWPESECDCDC